MVEGFRFRVQGLEFRGPWFGGDKRTGEKPKGEPGV